MSELAKPRLSVVVPTYNESANIAALVTEILRTGDGIEVVVVDDASPDGTADVVRQGFAGDPRVRLIVRTSDRGLAKSIRTGLEAAAGERVVVMDSDFNHDPQVIPTMRQLLDRFDMVVGSRFVTGGGMEDEFRYHCSAVYNILIRLVLGTRIQDNLSGFFGIRRQALQKVDYDSIFFGYGDYYFRLLSAAVDLKLSIVEIPIFYRLRTGGESKTSFVRVLGLYTKELLQFAAKQGIKRRPLTEVKARR
jgi:dolichol-phosphate mannosyltransferase